MKKILSVVIFITGVLMSVFVSAKEKIVVFPFTGVNETNARYSTDDGSYGTAKIAENCMIDTLVATKQFEVVERAALKKIIEEQKLALTGAINAEDAVQVGNLLGASYAVIGSISEASFKMEYGDKGTEKSTGHVTLQLRIVSVSTGSILFSESFQRGTGIFDIFSGSPKAEDLLGGYVKGLFDGDIKNKTRQWFPIRGYIISIYPKTESVMIDVGSELAVKKDDRFWVIGVTERVHPKTKKKIRIESRIGKIRVEEVQGADASNAKIEDGRDQILAGGDSMEIERVQ